MIRLADPYLAPVARLARHPDGKTLVELLKAEVSALQDKMLTCPRDQLEEHRLTARRTQEIIELIEQAPDLFEKVQAKKV